MIKLKSDEEIECIRKAGDIVSKTLSLIGERIRAGMATYELDKIAKDFIIKNKAKPAFKGYRGFPRNICVSIDSVIVHGIPDKKTFLKEGNIVGVDVGVEVGGYFADSAYTFSVGNVKGPAKKLIQVTKEALYRGIDKAKAGSRLGDISFSIQDYVESRGFSVVRDFVGHGVGYELHEDPEVPNFGRPNSGVRLESGMVLAIEPMVNEGAYYTEVLDDGWTVVTKDGSLSCHFEHTICITNRGPDVLTKWQKEMC